MIVRGLFGSNHPQLIGKDVTPIHSRDDGRIGRAIAQVRVQIGTKGSRASEKQ